MRLLGFGVLLAFMSVGCGGSIDDAATGAGRSNGTGEPSRSDAGGPPAAPRPACLIKTPLREGFENGLPADWGAANPGGLKLDGSQPIGGKTSLKLTPSASMKRSYFTRELSSVCAGTWKLSIRAEASLFAPGSKTVIARLTNSLHALGIVIAEKGAVELVEADLTTQDASGVVHPIGTLAPDAPATITITFDLAAATATGSVNPLGSPPGAPISSALTKVNETLSRMLVGLWSTNASGSFWLDDVALD